MPFTSSTYIDTDKRDKSKEEYVLKRKKGVKMSNREGDKKEEVRLKIRKTIEMGKEKK